MGSLGVYLMIFAGLSGVMSLFDYEFVLLSWIGTWGEGPAWFIRAALMAIGWGLWEMENRQKQPAAAPQGPVS